MWDYCDDGDLCNDQCNFSSFWHDNCKKTKLIFVLMNQTLFNERLLYYLGHSVSEALIICLDKENIPEKMIVSIPHSILYLSEHCKTSKLYDTDIDEENSYINQRINLFDPTYEVCVYTPLYISKQYIFKRKVLTFFSSPLNNFKYIEDKCEVVKLLNIFYGTDTLYSVIDCASFKSMLNAFKCFNKGNGIVISSDNSENIGMLGSGNVIIHTEDEIYLLHHLIGKRLRIMTFYNGLSVELTGVACKDDVLVFEPCIATFLQYSTNENNRKFQCLGADLRNRFNNENAESLKKISKQMGSILLREGYSGCFNINGILLLSGFFVITEINARRPFHFKVWNTLGLIDLF